MASGSAPIPLNLCIATAPVHQDCFSAQIALVAAVCNEVTSFGEL